MQEKKEANIHAVLALLIAASGLFVILSLVGIVTVVNWIFP